MAIRTEPFRKVVDKFAADVCSRVQLSDDARSVLVPQLSPQGFLGLLIERDLYADGVRFLAFALPIREGVWWACVTARAMLPEAPSAELMQCLKCAEAWVYAPGEAERRTCLTAAESNKMEGPAAFAALAAFWSGGNLAAEGMPEVPPDPSLGPIGVGASILLSVTGGDPTKMNDRFLNALTRGMNIADGGNGRLEGDARRSPAT